MRRLRNCLNGAAVVVLVFAGSGSASSLASESLWTIPAVPAPAAELSVRKNDLPQNFRPVEADLSGFQYFLTPHNRGEVYPLRVALPLPDGGFQYFLIEPSTLTPELFEDSDPDFLLFKGVAEDDASTRVQLEYSTSFGITARILDQDGRWFINPMGGRQVELGMSYYQRDTSGASKRQCGVTGGAVKSSRAAADELKRSGNASRDSGDIRNTYRIAIFTADNYDAFIYDSNKPDNEETQVYQAVGITLARATGIYETELSISFVNDEAKQRQLISSTDSNKSGSGPSLEDATAAINGEIGENSYDVGHVFAGSFRGVAYLDSVCSSFKGAGTTGLSNPVGDPFDVDYFSHELGHQFGGNHIHQYCNSVWGNIMEPGSGSTIMGYAGVCSPNVQSNSDPYFHSINFEEMRAFVESGGGASCGVDPAPATGNAIPTADAGADYTIPHSTPFMLTGSASDSDGDSLTYSWEQIDNNNPLFRVYNPVSSPSRYFPTLGQTSGFPETLPDGAATLNFRLTARDSNGGRAWDDMEVAVSASGSGFGVTAVNSSGASADVAWNVDGTNQAPISASEVTFYLSTDSGVSYPIEVASATNDGEATIAFPSGIQTDTARLMVKGKDNIFFSTSTVDFSINSSVTPSAPTISLQSKTYSSATISIASNGEGSAPITSYTTTCEAPQANKLSIAANKPQTYRLGEPTASGRSRINSNGTSVSIGRIYRPNPELSRAQRGDSLQFTLPDGRLLTAEVISSERTRYGNHLLKATQGADEILAVVNNDGDFVSSIKTAGNRFQSHILDGETLVYSQGDSEFADSPFNMDAVLPPIPIDPALAGSGAKSLTSAQNYSGLVEISVGIQYDNATRDAYDEVAEAEFAIAYANQAYQNSDVDISFNIVGARNYEGYVSSQDMAETLFYVTFGTINPSAWELNENVKAWRDQVKADLVVQLVRYGVSVGGGTNCGVAWTPTSDATFGSFYLPFYTHSVNALEAPDGSACSDVVVAHEMGHNFGLKHDRATDPDGDPYFSYARGYKNGSFGTVMSYTTNYAPYLSNPNKTYNGTALGVPIGQSAEAHSAQAVANKMHLHEAIYDNPSAPQTDTWVKISNTNQVVFTGLPAATQVSCSTIATSDIGNSSVSNVLTFITDTSAPRRPTITRSDYGDGEIYLYVTASNGGSDITGYDATCTDGASSFTGSSTSSPITVAGLTNDVAYTCTVTATNSVGTGLASAETVPITPEETIRGLPIWLLHEATK